MDAVRAFGRPVVPDVYASRCSASSSTAGSAPASATASSHRTSRPSVHGQSTPDQIRPRRARRTAPPRAPRPRSPSWGPTCRGGARRPPISSRAPASARRADRRRRNGEDRHLDRADASARVRRDGRSGAIGRNVATASPGRRRARRAPRQAAHLAESSARLEPAPVLGPPRPRPSRRGARLPSGGRRPRLR